MNWIKRLFFKDSLSRMAMSLQGIGKPKMTPHNYENFAREGYAKNMTVFRSINVVSRAASGIPWNLYTSKGKEITEHPLLTLLEQPNPMQGQAAFFNNFVGYYLLSGNGYIEQTKLNNTPPLELYSPRPDRMRIVPGRFGWPSQYIYKVGQTEVKYDAEVKDGRMNSNIIHLKTFNPTDDWYGMSPIEPGMFAIDQQNEAGKFNIALIQNQARPSGVLTVQATDARPSGTLTDEQFKKLKQEVDDQYTGSKNAGRPMLLEGGLVWNQMSLSPQQMSFIENKNVTSRDISAAFGVPPMMLGIPGDNTYSNYKEARLALYEDTVLPLMDDIRDMLNSRITWQFGEDLYLDYDKDGIDALVEKRLAKYTSISKAKELTLNERRIELGFQPLKGFDVLLVASGDRAIDSKDADFSQLIPAAPLPPTPSNEEPKKEDEGEIEDDEKDKDEKGFKQEFKIFNLLNSIERSKSAAQQERFRSRYETPMEKDLKTIFNEMMNEFEVIAENTQPDLLEFAFSQKLDEKYNPELEKTIGKHIRKISEDFGEQIIADGKTAFTIETKNAETSFAFWLNSFIKKRTAESVGHVDNTTKRRLRKAIKQIVKDTLDPENENFKSPAARIRDALGINLTRAKTIARTEILIASNNSSLNAVKAMEIPDMKKTWVTSNDDRVRESDNADHVSAHGQRVGIDEKFVVNPDTIMEGPGDPSAPIEQIINCRCALTYGRSE